MNISKWFLFLRKVSVRKLSVITFHMITSNYLFNNLVDIGERLR